MFNNKMTDKIMETKESKSLMVVLTHHTDDNECYTHIYPCSCEEQMERVFKLAIERVKKYCANFHEQYEDKGIDELEGFYYQEDDNFFEIWESGSPMDIEVSKMRIPYDTTEIDF